MKSEELRNKLKAGPVNWLLGKQLVAGMKWIAIYALYGEKLDSRDWMRGTWRDDDNVNDFLTSWRQKGEKEFWFDYFADSGDGQESTYNMAYLAMSDLWLDNEDAPIGGLSVSLDKNNYKLPRGEFLFVGGDTAYHIADFETLTERFQQPFNYAYDDLFGEDENPEHKKAIFAIPGNHDYYDALDGFHRQFCKPVTIPQRHPYASIAKYSAQLPLKGFDRYQEASYVALSLPFDWQFWGLDCQEGKLDTRQQAFFLSTCDISSEGDVHTPDKLIIATPEPTTKFGLYADEDAEITKTLNEKLWVTPSFLESHADKFEPEKYRLESTRCRLDISGDIHHYTRYWGQGEGSKTPNYASVVSGGGGAFLHATHTDLDDVKAESRYPTKEDSYHLMMKRLLNPLHIWQGGSIWIAGGILILACYFSLTIPDSSWAMFSGASDNPLVSWSSEFQLIPDTLRPCGAGGECAETLLQRIQHALSVEGILNQQYSLHLFDLISIFILFGLTGYGISKNRDKNYRKSLIEASPEEWKRYKLIFRGKFVFSAVLMSLVTYLSESYQDPLFPAFASLLAFMFIVVAVMLLILARQLANLSVKRIKHITSTNQGASFNKFEREIYTWPLITAAIVMALFGSWRYGVNSAAVALTDTISLLVIPTGFLGLIALAWFGGGALVVGKAKQRFLAIGIWHATVQFSLALLLALYADLLGASLIVAAIIAITLFVPTLSFLKVGEGELSIEKQEAKATQLFLIWLAVGLLAIVVTLFVYGGDAKEVTWLRLIVSFCLGAVLSCVWFGWYLVVSLGFNGHNNEAGGGARVAAFRHFIRFKITENKLTGYVIGLDDPSIDFTKERSLRLVDVFTLHASKK